MLSTEAGLQLNLARCLCKSIEKSEVGLIKQLVYLGANPNLLMPEGITPFHLAVGMDYPDASDVTQILLSVGANPNVRSAEGLTPVHVSASWGTLKILELLLNHGGDPYAQDSDGKDALDLADEHQQYEAQRILLTYIRRNKESSVTESLEETINFLNLRCNHITSRRPKQRLKRSSSLKLPKLFPELQCCAKLPEEESSCPSNNSIRVRRVSDSFVTYTHNSATLSGVMDLSKFSDNTPQPCKVPTELNIAIVSDSKTCYVPNSTTEDETKHGFSDVFTTCAETFLDRSNDENSSSSSVNFIKEMNLRPDQIIACDPTTQRLLDELVSKSSTFLSNEEESFDGNFSKKDKLEQSGDKTCGFDEPKSKNDVRLLDLSDSSSESTNSNEISGKSKSCDNLSIHFSWNSTLIDTVGDQTLIRPRKDSKDLTTSTNHSWKSYRNNSGSEGDIHSEIAAIPLRLKQLNNSQLRAKLIELGDSPGPISDSTRHPYLLRLARIEAQTFSPTICAVQSGPVYSKELLRVLKGKIDLPVMQALERDMCKGFQAPNAKWREGSAKCCFNYLLLDPRVTQNLPQRINSMNETESLSIFLASIFYIGKGKRSRPYSHLNEAIQYQNKSSRNPNAKTLHILDIWKEKMGVVSLHCFQNVIPVEAYTREACMVEAIQLDNLTNARHGEAYGAAAKWSAEKRRQLGSFLLFRALRLFENEGEQQIFPTDL